MREPTLIARVYSVDNGWLVETEDEVVSCSHSPDAEDGAEDIAEAQADALRAVSDAMRYGSRYDEGRVRVIVEPGDKHDDAG